MRPVVKSIERQLLESRRDTLATDLKGWRARRPLADQTRRLEAELRAVDRRLDALDCRLWDVLRSSL